MTRSNKLEAYYQRHSTARFVPSEAEIAAACQRIRAANGDTPRDEPRPWTAPEVETPWELLGEECDG